MAHVSYHYGYIYVAMVIEAREPRELTLYGYICVAMAMEARESGTHVRCPY